MNLITGKSIFAIADYEEKYKHAFESLNRTWIEKYFSIEPADELVLTQPQEHIIDPGGAILLALDNSIAIGTVGLQKMDDSTFELIKMAVDENYRGKGVGELLGRAVIQRAWEKGATKIILYSNSSLKPALSLYRKLGFKDIPLEADHNEYIRSDVKMILEKDHN